MQAVTTEPAIALAMSFLHYREQEKVNAAGKHHPSPQLNVVTAISLSFCLQVAGRNLTCKCTSPAECLEHAVTC